MHTRVSTSRFIVLVMNGLFVLSFERPYVGASKFGGLVMIVVVVVFDINALRPHVTYEVDRAFKKKHLLTLLRMECRLFRNKVT